MEAWTQELLRLSSLFADRMQDGDRGGACRSDVANPVLCIADKRADKIFQFLRMAPGICRRSREGVARDRMLVPIQPEPGPARAVTVPSTGSSRSVRTAPAMSRYSNQEAIGDTAITCALGSTKVGFDNGSAPASACAIAESQPVTPPIFMMSTIEKLDAPAAMAFAIPSGNPQFSPI